MKYFDQQFTNFLKSLSKDNTKEWFDSNRDVYENFVKKPFEAFVTDLIGEIRKVDPSIRIMAKEAIFRINKDTRFSKDKTPYKTSVSAAISAGGKNSEFPGIYVEMNHEKVNIIGGCYVVEKDNLLKIRKYIGRNLDAFQKLISGKGFKNSFGSVLGEKSKLLTPELKLLVEKEPLVANKQFYFSAEMPASEITRSTLLSDVMNYYQSAKPLNDFLIKALTTK